MFEEAFEEGFEEEKDEESVGVWLIFSRSKLGEVRFDGGKL